MAGPWATGVLVTPLSGHWGLLAAWRGVDAAARPLPMPHAGLGAAGTNPVPLSASLQAVTPCSPAVNYELVSESPPHATVSRVRQAELWGRWVGWDTLFCTGHGASLPGGFRV